MVVSGGAVSPENRSNERRSLEDLRATVDRASSLASLKPFARDLIDLVAAVERERDAAVAENARLLARIAAVEAAIPAILMPIEMLRHGLDCTMRLALYDGARCVCSLRAQISERVEAELRAALAASPPTRPEPRVEIGGQTMTQEQFDAARFPLLASDPGDTK